jgi:hypothetical protein
VKRTVWLVGWIHVALFAWFSVHHQDRYLQGLMPLMASATAAMMILVWRQHGVVVRGVLGTLVAFQLVWGGDVYFFQTHAMARSPLKKSIDLLSAGFEKRYAQRFNVQSSYQAIGKALPPGARVLMHETNINLGTGHTTVLDNPGWQYAIEYGAQKSPADVHALLAGLGVTHLHAKPDKTKGTDSLAGDIRFHDYLRRYAENLQQLPSGVLGELGEAPEGPFDDSVAVLSCGQDYAPGLYQVTDLSTPPFGPRMKDRREPSSARHRRTREPRQRSSILRLRPRASGPHPVSDRACSSAAAARRRVGPGWASETARSRRSAGIPRGRAARRGWSRRRECFR